MHPLQIPCIRHWAAASYNLVGKNNFRSSTAGDHSTLDFRGFPWLVASCPWAAQGVPLCCRMEARRIENILSELCTCTSHIFTLCNWHYCNDPPSNQTKCTYRSGKWSWLTLKLILAKAKLKFAEVIPLKSNKVQYWPPDCGQLLSDTMPWRAKAMAHTRSIASSGMSLGNILLQITTGIGRPYLSSPAIWMDS